MASRRSRQRPNKRALNWDETPRTGWHHDMAQEESSELSQWLATRADAMLHAREAAAAIESERQRREQKGQQQ